MKSKYIHLPIVALCLCSATILSYAEKKASYEALKPINSIAAIVNKDVITQSDLDTQARLISKQLQQQSQKVPTPAVLKKQVLNQLIALKLQVQQAQKEGISISDAQVDQAINSIAKQNRITVAVLKQQVVEQGLTLKQYHQQIQDQLAINAVQRQEIKERISVSDKEMAAAMRTLNTQAAVAPMYHLLAILVPVPTAPSPNEIQAAQRKATAVIKNLNQGEKFTDVAIALSAGGDALQGGDMGWKQITDLPPQLTAKVAVASQGQVLGPFQMPNGFLILKVAGIKSTSADQKVSTRDLRNQVREMVYQRKYQQVVEKWVKQLRAVAFIKIMI